MRLPLEKVKDAILHPDRQVREAAVYYFSQSYSRDATLMPLAIAAFERHGLDAFETYGFLQHLVQTDETVAWLIREIERIGAPRDERESSYASALIDALVHADALVLKRYEEAIHAMEHLDSVWKRAIDDPIFISSFTFDELWQDLVELDEDEHGYEDEADNRDDYEYGCAVVDALLKFPEQCAPKVLSLLADENQTGWLEVMAIRLAGMLQLEAAIPRLIKCLPDFDTWAANEASEALVRIGTDEVVQQLFKQIAKTDWDYRMAAAWMLGNIHTDLSVQTCFTLLNDEQDSELRGLLLRAILVNFSPQGIEPARQYVLSTPKSPDVLEVRSDLLVCCKLLGETFPEFDEWLKDSAQDVEFRRQWYKDHPLNLDALLHAFEDDDLDEDDYDVDFDEVVDDGYEGAEPIVRHGERIGRNDPCPCGSGKKYKKCCYGKDGAGEASDLNDAYVVTSAVTANRPVKFPIGTLALYGPDDVRTTKIVAGVIKREGAEPILERWVGTHVRDNTKVKRQIQQFFDRHKVKNVAATQSNVGCPHEEGLDFPVGEDCPFCPYWAGKQGSKQKE